MGCCRSSPMRRVLIDPPLTLTETMQLETFLSGIPDHCRSMIVNLPARQLLNSYQYHSMALRHGLKREWSLAISCEHRALKGLQALLPTQKDHYIFFDFYTVLSASSLALGEFDAAIEELHIALAILLKHTPMDYRTITSYYHHLASAFLILKELKATVHYLIKAMETARLMTNFDQEYLDILEAELQIAEKRLANDAPYNFTYLKVRRKQGESDHDFHRRKTAEIIIFKTQHSHRDQFEHLPNNTYRDCLSNDR